MGFCTDTEYEEFMDSVLDFEHMLIRSGIKLLKYYLDISKAEQAKRLDERGSPCAMEVSALDKYALKKWDQYSLAQTRCYAHPQSRIAVVNRPGE